MKKFKKTNDIDYEKLAKITPSYAAKDIELLVREACICALKQKADVSNEHLLQAKQGIALFNG